MGLLLFLFLIFLIFNFIVPRFGKQKKENVALTYWGLWEDNSIVKPIISDFEKENPNIKISYSKQDPKQYRQRLITRIQNGSGPDIFRFHNTWLPMLSKVLVPLPNDVLTKKDFQEAFYKVSEEDLIKNGAIYAVPLQIDTLALFVNQEIFQAAGANVPISWDEFIRISRGLTVKDENGRIKTAGAAMGTFDNITHAPDIISLLFVQNGVLLRNFSSNPSGISDSLDFYTSFAKGDSNVWDTTLDSSILAFS
ncbi:MAG: extracellular solute-binding protein, partial [bacterium]|nr:extracellular solute-binding protein [bacterium]